MCFTQIGATAAPSGNNNAHIIMTPRNGPAGGPGRFYSITRRLGNEAGSWVTARNGGLPQTLDVLSNRILWRY
jgi:hypothetical protein